MSTYIKEKTDLIDGYLTEFRTSPELTDHSEAMTVRNFFNARPQDLIEEITRYAYYDEGMNLWMKDNIEVDRDILALEILSIYLRAQWSTMTFNALEGLKIGLPDYKYKFVINEIKELIKGFNV